MKDFSKATPRPWILDSEKTDITADHDFSTLIVQMRGWGWLSKKHGGKKALEIQQANAELIVTAVNNFDKMKEALEKHLAILKALTDAGIIEKHENSKYSIIEETEQLLESIK